MEKPLIRYTIGGKSTSDLSINILNISIKKIQKIFKDKVDYAICYNNLDMGFIEKINNGFGNKFYKIKIIDQLKFKNSLPYRPVDVSWKLYPPRLRLSAHEIFIDNDIIIERLPDQVSDFLKEDKSFFFTEGLNKNNFGNFQYWQNNIKFNSGFFGLPPNFDFRKSLIEKMKKQMKNFNQFKWIDQYDEQGIVGCIILEQKNIKEIKLDCVGIFENNKITKGLCGYHFVKSNIGKNKSWMDYLNQRCTIL